jgi:hypothetical protein
VLQKSPTLTPSLENLSYILRHREWWPDGFRWNFRYRNSCAIGLCQKIYGVHPTALHEGLRDSELTYEPSDVYGSIFCAPKFWVLGMGLVTPELVAKRIDRFLARHHG